MTDEHEDQEEPVMVPVVVERDLYGNPVRVVRMTLEAAAHWDASAWRPSQ